jgi:hypothetical protein
MPGHFGAGGQVKAFAREDRVEGIRAKGDSARWSYRSPIALNPGANGILQALEGLANRRFI